ncbi:CEP44 protein, partial [Phaetusa simplex]|nr:CEP44 protein [Phaetusa simplex]
MATGDLKGSLRKIEQGLRLLNYPRDVDYTHAISTTNCMVILKVKQTLTLLQVLRDQFQYKPILTKQQFLQFGFAERKMQIVCDIINCVVKKHKELSNSNKVKSQTRKKPKSFTCEVWSNCDNVLTLPNGSALNSKQKPLVERHSGNEVGDDLRPLPLPAQGGGEELHLDHDVVEVKCEQVAEDNSQIEFLKSQLADCQEKLHKLDWMEDKLHGLEEKMKGKVIIDEKDWNNLLSRVLLLETQLLLQSKK